MNRSTRPDVRNPMLKLPGVAERLAGLSPIARAEMRSVCLAIRTDAQERAEACWRKHKAPMAFYWKVVSVYSGHLSRLLR